MLLNTLITKLKTAFDTCLAFIKDNREILQIIAATALVSIGGGLSIAIFFNLKYEVYLAISVPVLIAGISMYASILDPRDRYVINHTSNSYFVNGRQVNSNLNRYSPTVMERVRRALSNFNLRASPPNSDETTPPNSNELARDRADTTHTEIDVNDNYIEEFFVPTLFSNPNKEQDEVVNGLNTKITRI